MVPKLGNVDPLPDTFIESYLDRHGQAGAFLRYYFQLIQIFINSNDVFDPDTGLRVLHKSINLQSFVLPLILCFGISGGGGSWF